MDVTPDREGSDRDYLEAAESGPQSCLFCRETAWSWLHILREDPIPGPIALPRFVVTCDRCQDDLAHDRKDALVERLTDDFGTDAAALMTLFESSTTAPATFRRPPTPEA